MKSLPGYLQVPFDFDLDEMIDFYFENLENLRVVRDLFLKLQKQYRELEESLKSKGIKQIRLNSEKEPIERIQSSLLALKCFNKFYSGRGEIEVSLTDSKVNTVSWTEKTVVHLNKPSKQDIEHINQVLEERLTKI